MSVVGIDSAAAMELGEQVVAVAADVDDAKSRLAMQSCLAEPPATAAAVRTLITEFSSGIERLSDDVVALGRLVQATAADFEDVDAAAAGMGGP